ncbi:MAG: hypothetical protein ACRD9R_23715 [Pyrinomonadaceae bacterium]
MSEERQVIDLTPGWQCCLLCGRTLTDRASHDRVEEPVLAAIRAEHPQWAAADGGGCAECLKRYRELLRERATRAEAARVENERRPASWLLRLFGNAEQEQLNFPA